MERKELLALRDRIRSSLRDQFRAKIHAVELKDHSRYVVAPVWREESATLADPLEALILDLANNLAQGMM